jgi:hypothetical protein
MYKTRVLAPDFVPTIPIGRKHRNSMVPLNTFLQEPQGLPIGSLSSVIFRRASFNSSLVLYLAASSVRESAINLALVFGSAPEPSIAQVAPP